ncbi:four helix bundle protein [Paenibacillus sp. MER 78]|uniref:four helix bundle protein n=1 Tax=Paenibacillus sp. MER 78 TaxID=2939571 RepID=UPI0020411F4D|nr:four helix bundle protein [Paenibacillus sp. MER 78]MCM3128117.1 four helix bundle protein [Paenibacillus sp. MER 78]
MLSVGTIIDGSENMKPAISLQEARETIKHYKMENLFELAWEAYSKEWDHGYAWFDLKNGKVVSGHEHLIDPKHSYLILLKISEADYLFEWDDYDEESDYEKFKERLSLREWCELKGFDYRERIRTEVLRDPGRWNEYHQLHSKLYIGLNDWYRKHDETVQTEYSTQNYQVDNKAKNEQLGESKEKDYFLRDFKTLILYKKAVELEDMIDKLAESFPIDEKYRLTDQLIRCVTSIGANVAESNGGQYAGREKYHLGVAFQSANEVRYWVERAFRKKYIDKITYERLDEEAQELRRIMVGMFKRLDGLNGESV